METLLWAGGRRSFRRVYKSHQDEPGNLHVWLIGKGKYACIVSLATYEDVEPDYFKAQLRSHEELVHISVEVNRPG